VVHWVQDPAVSLEYLSGWEAKGMEGLVVRAAGRCAADDEFGRVDVREVAEEVSCFGGADPVISLWRNARRTIQVDLAAWVRRATD
jgi:hypothetical protein